MFLHALLGYELFDNFKGESSKYLILVSYLIDLVLNVISKNLKRFSLLTPSLE